MPPSRVYPVSQNAGPSTYHNAVDSITRRFMPSSLADLDDAEYYRRHDEFYGMDSNDEEDDEERDENSNMKVLDALGIWGAIQEWMFGTMNYPSLLELIAFQYDFDSKIQYWEDFLSRLTYVNNLAERESLFRSIPLAEHLSRISNYRVSAEDRVDLPSVDLPSVGVQPAPEPYITEAEEARWAVNIVPRKYFSW